MDLIIAALVVLLIVLVVRMIPYKVVLENMYLIRNDIPTRFKKLGGSSVEIDPLEYEHLRSRINPRSSYKAKYDWRDEYDSKGNPIPDKLDKLIKTYAAKVENCCSDRTSSSTDSKKESLSNLDNHCGGSLCSLVNPGCPPLNRIGLEAFGVKNDKIIGIQHFENGDVDRTWSSTIYTRNDEPHFNPTTPKPIFANLKYLQNRGKYKCYDKCEKLGDSQSRSECMDDCLRLSATVY